MVRPLFPYIPVHTQPDFQRLGFRQGDFPDAEAYYSRAVSLPMYPAITGIQQDKVVQALRESLGDVGGDAF